MATDYDKRKYDIVLFGATGFTGALTAEYLAEIKDHKLSWAIAGRNLAKLEKVRDRLSELDSTLKDLDIIIADSTQPETLVGALSQTRVVISTVGPFVKYGTPLVEACIKQKTHYVDITGEYNWIKLIIDKYHQEAQERGVMIVPSCGFDCVPSDIGCYILSQHMQQKHNLDLTTVKMSVIDMKGGVSGGTIQSALGVINDTYLNSKEKTDPYVLATRRGVDKPSLPTMRRDHDFCHGKKWQFFYIMSVVNEPIVRRSWSIWADRGKSYGNMFSYKESMSLKFVPGFLMTVTMYTVLPLLLLLMKVPFLSRRIQEALPGSGSGPSSEQRAEGCYEVEFVGTADTEPYDKPVRARAIVKGFKDPGYGDTCRMVAQSALCIVKSLKELPGKEGGVLTSATAFGNVLVNRLTKNREMVMEVHDI